MFREQTTNKSQVSKSAVMPHKTFSSESKFSPRSKTISVDGRNVIVDVSGLEEHITRLREKVIHLEEKIDVLCWLADEDKDDDKPIRISTENLAQVKSKAANEAKTFEDKIIHLKLNEVKLKENRGERLKSKVQSYDIRDAENYAGILEIEQLLRTQMAQESRAVDIADVFRGIVKNLEE